MVRNRVLARAILGSASWVALTTAVPAAAFAQAEPIGAPTPTPSGTEEVVDADGTTSDDQVVVVTGSRIPRPENSGTLPGVQITGETIEARGFTNALEALNEIPLVGPGASPLTGNNGGQTASLGAAFVDLLDLGTQRTLTLLNGRRFVSGNAASLFVEGNATGSQVDINVIPSSLIQRVDVLTVGGAATYGTDAIAGVVNFILKDDFDGVEARALAGISERGDAAQYQLNVLAGENFADGRGNIVVSAEYTRNDGLQADARDFRLARYGTYANPFNGGIRNPAFASAIIDQQGSNNGAFLRATDDLQPASIFSLGLVNQTISYNGTVLLQQGARPTPYVPLTSGTGATATTSNYISFLNGISSVGFALPGTRTATGAFATVATPNNGTFQTGGQTIQGTPGASAISGNGLNGRTTAIANLPFTTFAPTALPANVTAAQVFTQFGIAPPAGSSAAQQTALAINVLQANRFTAREFLAANPNVNPNYFIGTFNPGAPRVANTDTTLVTVRSNSGGGTVQVPINQVLPFVAVPLEFNGDGTLRVYNFTGPLGPATPLNPSAAVGGDGGFIRSLENTVLRTQQERYIANVNGTFQLNDELQVFTENVYAKVINESLGNIAGVQNFVTGTPENAPLTINVSNPYLSTQARNQLAAVGITAGAANGGNFLLTRQNQDIFGDNPYRQEGETIRSVLGIRSEFNIGERTFRAELSGTYGHVTQNTESTTLNDVEYQLALDVATDSSGTIRCRSQLFPQQYLGRTPIGTAANLTRVIGADGIPTEIVVTPTITQSMIDSCQPLNPFGYNNMSEGSKQYVRQLTNFENKVEQIFLQATIGGDVIQLPAGTLGFSATAEYRRENLEYASDALNQLGRGRSAPSANTVAFTETYEVGGELLIPIFGRDFLPFLGELNFTPGLRVTKQNGEAQTFRNLAGQLVTPTSEGDPQTIFNLGGTWRVIPDILIRGNFTRAVRQPSAVELFLGGQPVFTTPTDFCSTANIDQGTLATNRRNNCRQDVIRLVPGITTTQQADAFLAQFVANPFGLQGTYSGTPDLQPEKAESWTVGAVLEPRFLPGLSLGADYISLDLNGIIIPTTFGQAAQFCYDSPVFGDSSGQVGVNSCNFFSRDNQFQLQNGFGLGFLNLSATEIRAVNINALYPINLPQNLGRFVVRGNVYHLINYRTSAAGDFSDVQETAGTFTRPQWEAQVSGRYENESFFAQLTWNWQDRTRVFSSGIPATTEVLEEVIYPSTSQFNLTVGAEVNDELRVQFIVNNIGDSIAAGDIGLYQGAYIDQIGRRFLFSVTSNF